LAVKADYNTRHLFQVLMTQYFDTLKEIGHGGKCSTIFIPTAPSSVGNASQDFMQSMLNANMQANAALQ